MCLVFPAENLQCLKLISSFLRFVWDCAKSPGPSQAEPSRIDTIQSDPTDPRRKQQKTKPKKNLFYHLHGDIKSQICLCIDLCAYKLANLDAFYTVFRSV